MFQSVLDPPRHAFSGSTHQHPNTVIKLSSYLIRMYVYNFDDFFFLYIC